MSDETSTSALPGMGGLLGNLSSLSTIRQIGILLGIAASVALGISIVLWTRDPLMRPLPTADRQTTYQIIQYLEQQKIPYQLESDGALLVPQESYQKVQLQLASQGMDGAVSDVDALLAKDTGFATSQRLEQARLLRTQEVKLARTIEKIAGIKAAEVHLAIPKESVFMRDADKPRASVLLNLNTPKTLDSEQVRAIVDMITGSVPNLDPTHVTITDQFGRLHHSGTQTADEAMASREFAESRKRETEYQQKIERVLSPIIGDGKYTVEVNVDMDFSETEQTQKLYNAELPAMVSERTLNEQNGGAGAQGVPGALSNQPPTPATAPEVANAQDGASGAANAANKNGRQEAERNFDHDTTIAHTRNQIGVVRRITVSIGLDYVDAPIDPNAPAPAVPNAPATPSKKARPAEDIASITQLIQSAIGYDGPRGDRVEIHSFPFVTVTVPTEPVAIPFHEQEWFQLLLKPLIALILGLALVFGVLKPVMGKLSAPAPSSYGGSMAMAGGAGGLPGMAPDQLSLSGSGATASMSLPPPVTTELGSVARAKAVVQSDPALVANVVKNWMERDA